MTSTVGITTATASLDRALLDAAGLQPGGRVLDVGCGVGDTTLDGARRVGPSGLALGVDDSLTMLEQARRTWPPPVSLTSASSTPMPRRSGLLRSDSTRS